MQSDISKICSDFIRQQVQLSTKQKLKASHARELVAAFFGYKSHAALLAEKAYPLSYMHNADVLIPDIPLVKTRYEQLQELPPLLPTPIELATLLKNFLLEQEEYSFQIWLNESLCRYISEEYLTNDDIISYVEDALSPVIAETGSSFDYMDFNECVLTEELDKITISVDGEYSGEHASERIFSGDKIDFLVEIVLKRIAGRSGFSEPDIFVGGQVNDEWRDTEIDDMDLSDYGDAPQTL